MRKGTKQELGWVGAYGLTCFRVPWVSTVGPWEWSSGEGGKKESQSPRYYYIVIEIHIKSYQRHCIPYPYKTNKQQQEFY